MAGPLKGMRVLDLTRILAGPYATMILRDLGAEVIKIEQPGTGDEARDFGPFKNDFSLYFMSVNRGKKSVTLNLKSPRGKNSFWNGQEFGYPCREFSTRDDGKTRLRLRIAQGAPTLSALRCMLRIRADGTVCNARSIRYDHSRHGRNYQHNRRAGSPTCPGGNFNWRYNVGVVHRYRDPLRTSTS